MSDLKLGMPLETVTRRLDYEGKNGLIIYGPAYRPVFRDKKAFQLGSISEISARSQEGTKERCFLLASNLKKETIVTKQKSRDTTPKPQKGLL